MDVLIVQRQRPVGCVGYGDVHKLHNTDEGATDTAERNDIAKASDKDLQSRRKDLSIRLVSSIVSQRGRRAKTLRVVL